MVAELNGVVHEIIEYLLKSCHICMDIHFIAGQDHLNSNGFVMTGALKGTCSITDHLIDIKNLFYLKAFLWCSDYSESAGCWSASSVVLFHSIR